MVLKEKLAAAFNEWQRQYIEEPAAFETQWACIRRTLEEREGGRTPTYGEHCAAYLETLVAGLDAAAGALPPEVPV